LVALRVCTALPVRALVPLMAVCLGHLVFGVVGNVLMVLVARSRCEMKTRTNLCLGSMAISDLLILLALPFDLYPLRSRPWILGQLLCCFSLYLSKGCTCCTILHITALTVERCLATCFPLRAVVVVTKRQVKAVIAILWVFAFLSAGPFVFSLGVEQPDNHTGFSPECKPTPQATESSLQATRFCVTTSYFILPIICLHVLYGFIGRELWRSSARLQGPNVVLSVVVLAFVICWLPFHIGRIIFMDTKMMLFSQYFNTLALQLFCLSASINPVLHNLILKKYRAAAYKLLVPH
ncbi:LOW QUALITY PROTEIN: motilin receptor, partial [Phaethornis superciliosus]